jgi:hypothetical protein
MAEEVAEAALDRSIITVLQAGLRERRVTLLTEVTLHSLIQMVAGHQVDTAVAVATVVVAEDLQAAAVEEEVINNLKF